MPDIDSLEAPPSRLSPAADAWIERLFCLCLTAQPVLDVLREIVRTRLAMGLQKVPATAVVEAATAAAEFSAESFEALRAEAAARDFLAAAKARVTLPSPPLVMVRLREIIDDPNVALEDVAEVVHLDPRLAAALLRLVNSPLYHSSTRVETIARAVTALGTRHVYVLALAAAVTTMFEDVRPPGLDLERFWRHSLASAVLAHSLAQAAGWAEPERCYLGGLLHDIGKLALYAAAPRRAQQAQRLHSRLGLPLDQAERRFFDFDHAMLGAVIFASWGLPDSVVAATLLHAAPRKAPYCEVAAAVHVANVLAVALGFGVYADDLVPPLFMEAWDRLSLPPSVLPEVTTSLDATVRALAEAEAR